MRDVSGDDTRRIGAIDRAIDEYVQMKGDPASLAASVLETVLYLEEVFHLTLTDAEIETADLRSARGIKQFVMNKLSERS
jgi:hypothetical protein